MLGAGGLNGPDIMRHAMTRQAELVDRGKSQQTRISRAVRGMTGRASFGLYRSVFIGERALLVRVTFDTSRIPARGEPGLFELESAMRVVAITATHCPFQDFVVGGHRERRLDLAVATDTELRIIRFQHSDSWEARLFRIRFCHQHV